jgi:pyridoxine kinase
LETRNIRNTLEHTAAAVYGILDATHKAASRELLLIEAQKELVSPKITFKARKITGTVVRSGN